jgi:hypothetical protein
MKMWPPSTFHTLVGHQAMYPLMKIIMFSCEWKSDYLFNVFLIIAHM